MHKTIEKYIKERSQVRIFIEKRDDLFLDGYILKQNEEFILFFNIIDFFYNGLVIVPKSSVMRILYEDSRRHLEKMQKGEGVEKELDEKQKLFEHMPFEEFHTMGQVFHWFSKAKLPVLLSEIGEQKYYHYGVITGVKTGERDDGYSELYIRILDSLGLYADDDEVLDLIDITFIRFDYPYLNVFHKYAEGKEFLKN